MLATAYFRAAGDRNLGIVYYTNRPSFIVRITLPDPTKPSRLPRVWFPSDEKDEVALWLSSEREPHGSCSGLHMMELPTKAGIKAKMDGKPILRTTREENATLRRWSVVSLLLNFLRCAYLISLLPSGGSIIQFA